MAQGSIIKVNGKRGATYAIRFYGQDGKRHYETIGPKKGDAARALRQILNQIDRGEYRPGPDITFAELAGKWLELSASLRACNAMVWLPPRMDGR